MTSSRDSLIPDVPNKSEAEARCAKALKAARYTLNADTWNRDPSYRASLMKAGLEKVVHILDGGRS